MSVPADLMTNTSQATIAYQDALNQARNAQNSLFRSYGLTSADANGNYSVEGAQGAFDPNTLFANSNTGLDINKITELSKGLQINGTGRLADIEKAGASGVSDVTGAAQRAGFGADTGVSGGIINQRQQLARSQAEANLASGKQEFLTAEANALNPIGQASSNFKQAQFQDQAATREATAQQSIWDKFLNTPFVDAQNAAGSVASNTPSDRPPSGAKQYQRWKNSAGVQYQFVNGKWKTI
jgi:hypothetical protein